jgi:hypothetical protein
MPRRRTSRLSRVCAWPRDSEIRRLREALARVIRPDFIGPWLQNPNQAFSGLKPIEVIERGEVDRLRRMIYELESGIPT